MAPRSGEGCVGCLVTLMIMGVAFLALSLLALTMALIAYAIYHIFRWLFTPQPRPFGAWPMSRWSMAFEHAQYRLEQSTGVYWNSCPEGIIASSALTVLVPFLVLGGLLSAFHPTWVLVLPSMGAIIGVGTGVFLSQPRPEWFGGFELAVPTLEGDIADLMPEDLALLDMMSSDQDW